MEIDIKKYKKDSGGKNDSIITGISITRDQKIFVESRAINLSALVRDVLRKLIDQVKNEESKK